MSNPSTATIPARPIGQSSGPDSALAEAKERTARMFGEFGSINPAVMTNDGDWKPANHYPKWTAYTFRDDKECDLVIKFIESMSRLRFAPQERLMSTVFFPEEASSVLSYFLGLDINRLRIPETILSLAEQPEITKVYRITGLIPRLQFELRKPASKMLWFRAKRPRPITVKSYSKLFLPIEYVDDFVAELFRSDKVFKAWCEIANQ